MVTLRGWGSLQRHHIQPKIFSWSHAGHAALPCSNTLCTEPVLSRFSLGHLPPCTQSPHFWTVTCSSSHTYSCRAATPVPFPCQLAESRGHSLSPAAAPSHMHRDSPHTLLRAVIHVGGCMQKECCHPFAYSPSLIHTLTQSWWSPVTHAHPRAAHTPTPIPTAPHVQPTLPPLFVVTASHEHMCTHTDTCTQRFAWFPTAIPAPPSSQHSFSASQND